MILFPDTNFFLQFRDPAELPWRELGGVDEIRLLVCRAVQTEVDGFKGDGRERRADRARRVSAWFRDAMRGIRRPELRGRVLTQMEEAHQIASDALPWTREEEVAF